MPGMGIREVYLNGTDTHTHTHHARTLTIRVRQGCDCPRQAPVEDLNRLARVYTRAYAAVAVVLKATREVLWTGA